MNGVVIEPDGLVVIAIISCRNSSKLGHREELSWNGARDRVAIQVNVRHFNSEANIGDALALALALALAMTVPVALAVAVAVTLASSVF